MYSALMLVATIWTPASVFGQARVSDDEREASKFGWQFDYDKAKEVAGRTNRPLMVVLRCVP